MKAFTNGLFAVLRRFLAVAAAGIIAYASANALDWLNIALLDNKQIHDLWVILWPIIELVQKTWRENKRIAIVNELTK